MIPSGLALLCRRVAREFSSISAGKPGKWTRCILAGVAAIAAAAGANAQSTFAALAVGSTSAEQSVTVTSPSGGTVSSVEVLTLGVPSSDFAEGTGSGCANATLTAMGTCAERISFKPTAPGLRMGAVVLLDAGGGVIGTAYVSGVGLGGIGVLVHGNLLPYAGQEGRFDPVVDGQPATWDTLELPSGVTEDGAGNLYIADSVHNRVRMVCGASNTATIKGSSCSGAGNISTIAGNGSATFSGDGGPAGVATLNLPTAVALDGAGNLYIADGGNNRIRMISAATGNITTVAGNGTAFNGNRGVVGDGGQATAANLNQPWGVTVDASGNLFIADTYNHRIRKVDASTGIMSTVAGTGNTAFNGAGNYSGDGGPARAADLNYPHGVAFDSAGNMYIPDSQNSAIREVAAVGGVITPASVISTFAGNGTQGNSGDGGPANQAQLSLPSGVAIDPAGNLYIADTQNHSIRKVIAPTSGRPDAGQISTLLSRLNGDYIFDGNEYGIWLYAPMGLYFDAGGNLFIADYLNMVVRKLESSWVHVDLTSTPVRQGSTSAPLPQPIENDGNASLDLGTITPQSNAAVDNTVTSACSAGATLTVDGVCNIGVVFAPATTPQLTTSQARLTSTITTTEDTQPAIPAPNNPIVIELAGIAEPINGTTTTVISTPNPSGFGQQVTFKVTVSTGAGTGDITGTVEIDDTYNGKTTTLASLLALTLSGGGATGTGTFSTAGLGVGEHSIVATYSGDTTGHLPSSSTDGGATPYAHFVQEGTSTTLVSSLNPSAVGQAVTFTATVAGSGGGVVPSGVVQFMDGGADLGAPVTLTASGSNGVASYLTSTLANGLHQITAVYRGDAAHQILGSTSNSVSQDVLAASALTLASSLNPSFFGNAVTFTATIQSSATSPGSGQVVFLDNGVQIGTGTLVGNPGTAAFVTSGLGVGTHPITATYAGDTFNGASASAGALNQVVTQAQTATTVTATPSPGLGGMTETITATVTVTAGAGTPGGTISFSSGTTVLGTASLNASGKATITPTLSPGNYQIVATFAGDTRISGSASAALPLSILQATTQTSLAINPNPGLVTVPITFTATVTGNGATPTGTVSFTASGNSIGAAQLNGAGVAAITVSTLPVGSYTIAASYAGDANDAGSGAAPVTLQVVPATTATTLAISPSPGVVTQPVTFTARVTGNGGAPTGSVSFVANGNSIGAAALNAGVATLTSSALGVGTYAVTASYAGDAANGASSSTPVNETIGLIPTQTSLGTSTTGGSTPQTILIAVVTNGVTAAMPSGTVNFMNGTVSLGSASLDSSGVATLMPNLTGGVAYTISAAYQGDATHAPSNSATVPVNGTASGFSITVAPSSISMKTGTNVTVSVNLASNGGFSDTIAFGCGSLPVGVTCHFAPASVSLAANGVATTQLTIDTNNPLSGGASAMNRPGDKKMRLAGMLLPLSALFGFVFWRLRRRNTALLAIVLAAAACATAVFVSGCGGISLSSAAPGSYTIEIIGTGTNSNVIHFRNQTLTITE